jgi:hypothetical protein
VYLVETRNKDGRCMQDIVHGEQLHSLCKRCIALHGYMYVALRA